MIYDNNRLAHAYFFAKNYVISKGFAEELDWQDSLQLDNLTVQTFLKEISWVILSSGMNEKVIRRIFPSFMKAMRNFYSPTDIYFHKNKCYSAAMKIFGNKNKIRAIFKIVEYLHNTQFNLVKEKIEDEGIAFIQTFPYMGMATAYHLAKNIGLNVAKPDRHLVRIANSIGYSDPSLLCEQISSTISEKISLVDLVLWRYATLDKNYIRNISWFLVTKRAPI